jgi:Myosin-like coiled-coil protein
VLTRYRFRQKFKSFVDQYELRELHFTSILRSKDLEIQYHKARLEQQRKVQEMESSKSNQLTRQVSTFSQTEHELRSQLNIYVEKFKQVWQAKLVFLPLPVSALCTHAPFQTVTIILPTFLKYRSKIR